MLQGHGETNLQDVTMCFIKFSLLCVLSFGNGIFWGGEGKAALNVLKEVVWGETDVSTLTAVVH